jgi:hypothetical protein
MTRYQYSAIIVAVLVAASALPALTQSQTQQEYCGSPAQQKACRSNVFQLCAGEIPNVRKITACLRRNIERLSPDCAAVFADESR